MAKSSLPVDFDVQPADPDVGDEVVDFDPDDFLPSPETFATPSTPAVVVNSANVDKMLASRGLDRNKPEILSVVSFLPTVSGPTGERTLAGEVLDLQYLGRLLQLRNVEHLENLLAEDPDLERGLSALRENYQALIDLVRGNLTTLSSILGKMNMVKGVLDLRENDTIKSTVKFIRESRGPKKEQSNPNTTVTTPPLGSHSSYKDLMVCDLKFSPEGFKTFSNSKILGQLIIDLRSSLSSYSPQLLSKGNRRRESDRHPATLHPLPVETQDFTFRVTDMSSVTLQSDFVEIPTGYSLSVLSTFTSFVNSLPQEEAKRVKLLISSLSKEVRISAGIGRQSGTPLGQKYDITSFGQLGRIFGDLGDNIAGSPGGVGELASIVRISDGAGGVVLPYESREIVDPGSTVSYVPGSVFLVDSVVKTPRSGPNTGPMSEYSSVVKETVDGATDLLSSFMNYDDFSERLYFTSLTKRFYDLIADKIEIMGGASGAPISSKAAALSFALMVSSQSDVTLRYLLYRYVLELNSGITASGHTSTSTSETSGDTKPRGTDGPTKKDNFDTLGLPDRDDLTDLINDLDTQGSLISRAAGGPRERRGSQQNSRQNVRSSRKGSSEEIDTGSITETTSVITTIPISQRIEERIAYLFGGSTGPTQGPNGQPEGLPAVPNVVTFNVGEIESILDSSLSRSEMIFSSISDLYDRIVDVGGKISDLGPNVDPATSRFRDGDLLTKHRRLSKESLLGIVFEVAADLCSEFIAARFDSQDRGAAFSVVVDPRQNLSVASKVRKILGESTDLTVDPAYSDLVGGLKSIYNSLRQEESLIRDLIDIVKATSLSVTSNLDDAVRFFDVEDQENIAVRNIFDDSSMSPVLRNLSDEQMSLSRRGLSVILRTPDVSLTPHNQVVTPERKNALDSLLSSKEFDGDRGKNVKLISVGLPSGMLSSLRNPSFTLRSGEDTLRSATTDVVTVSVYRRDPQNPDVVFKPVRFLFDMNLFMVDDYDYPTVTSSTQLIRTAKVVDITGVMSPAIPVTLSELKSGTVYSFLTERQRERLFVNHVRDHLLKDYVRLMTGLSFTEYSFLSDDNLTAGGNVTPDVRSILSVLPIIPGAPLTGDLQEALDNVVDAIAENAQIVSSAAASEGFQVIFESLLKRSTDLKYQVEQPKLFERTFTVPIDPDDFEVEVKSSTDSRFSRSGVESLSRDRGNDVSWSDGTIESSEVTLNSSNHVISEYFATVTLGAVEN